MDKRKFTAGQWLIVLLGTGLGVGFLPKAPGTFGSVLGSVLAAFLKSGSGEWYPLIVLASILLSIPVCGMVGRWMNSKDPQIVVLDEIVAVMLVQAWFPVTVGYVLSGFFWFRVFDILKPPPARQLERLSGGWGIVSDDLMAAVYATAAVWVTGLLIPLA